jgi:dCTP deaminase
MSPATQQLALSSNGRAPLPGVLVDGAIKDAIQDKSIVIDPFAEDCLEPATYDMRIGDQVGVTGMGEVNLKKEKRVLVERGAMAIVNALEELRLGPMIVGRPGPKTSLLRHGIFVAIGPQLDPGYHGRLTVNMVNFGSAPFLLEYGKPFLSVEFHRLARAPDKTYKGEYQDKTTLSQDELNMVYSRGSSLADVLHGFTELQEKLAHLPTILELVKRLNDGAGEQAPPPLSLYINTLDEPYEVVQPIPVVVRRSKDSYIAAFFDGNVHASGETDQEAVDNLRDVLVLTLESLKDETNLSSDTARELMALRQFIRRKA